VTALTMQAGVGHTIVSALTTLTSSSKAKWLFLTDKWYRLF